MGLQTVIYFSFALFLLGIFGLFYSRTFVSLLISFHLIIVSGCINFLGFSLFLYKSSIWDKIFIFIGMISIYIFMFSLIFYRYCEASSWGSKGISKDFENFRLFELDLSSWWGED